MPDFAAAVHYSFAMILLPMAAKCVYVIVSCTVMHSLHGRFLHYGSC